ncbi:hypothetical protein [Motilimonas sp. KMU-193]|uniref:hypothetical protein n=1 Tax=Motilimonas sp. KMU-193 TaxID=3388668 RepID=UPI00396B0472
MSEVTLTIRFVCQPEHSPHWQTSFELLQQERRGWQLQDAIDPISLTAADALEEVWQQLYYGSDAFDIAAYEVDGQQCSLTIVTGAGIAQQLIKHFVPWLQSCPVSNMECKLSSEGD